MFDIGFWELVLVAIVALVVVGPERLPRLVRHAGLWVGRAQATITRLRADIAQELRTEELKQALNKPVELPDIKSDPPSTNHVHKEQDTPPHERG